MLRRVLLQKVILQSESETRLRRDRDERERKEERKKKRKREKEREKERKGEKEREREGERRERDHRVMSLAPGLGQGSTRQTAPLEARVRLMDIQRTVSARHSPRGGVSRYLASVPRDLELRPEPQLGSRSPCVIHRLLDPLDVSLKVHGMLVEVACGHDARHCFPQSLWLWEFTLGAPPRAPVTVIRAGGS